MTAKHIVIVDLLGFGFGEAPEANRYDSVGADGLSHTIAAAPETELATMTRWGLGNVRFNHPIAGLTPTDHPEGYHGRVHVAVSDWTALTGFSELWQSQPESTLAALSQVVPVQLISMGTLAGIDYPQALEDSDLSAFNTVSTTDEGVTYVRLDTGLKLALAGDVEGFSTWLMQMDANLARLSQRLNDNDWLVVTSTVAADPTLGRITREYVPLLIKVSGQDRGQALGIRRTLADISASVFAEFGQAIPEMGHPFLAELGELNHHLDGNSPFSSHGPQK